MNKLWVLSVVVILAFLAGCAPAQEGTAIGDNVPIDQIRVEDVFVPNDTFLPPPVPEPEEPETPADGLPAASGQNVVIVQETQLVKLRPVAQDPDADQLTFSYTTPLNAQGEWQTTYGDAGQYTVTITASDGELESSKDALIIVNKKEEPPTISAAEPSAIQQAMDENADLTFSVTASDLNKDTLTYSWKLDGEDVSQTESYTYRSDYRSEGAHTLKVEMGDRKPPASLTWWITVRNVDRAPVLSPIPDITVKETETVNIVPQAADPDDDPLEFTVSDPVGDDGGWQTTYDDAGAYTVTVAASDGELDDSQLVKVTVINVNRPPVIEDIIQVE